ncbi:MAG: hypothetical protein ACKOI0_04780 [Actinomycetota bacterium]
MRPRLIVAGLVTLAALAVPGLARPASAPPVVVPAEIPPDTGAGELLWVVVGGTYPTRASALAANDAMALGDLQGYYVVPVAQFQGFGQQVGTPDAFALVSAFRTTEGALAFVELATGYGVPATLLSEPVRSLGGVYAGLGQEARPDGTGPLLGPLGP